MRSILTCLLLCLLPVGLAVADDREARAPSVAEQVREAWREGNTYQLVALARKDEPDPWVVADDLCLLGAHEAALAFARAAVRQDTARLAEYLEKRGPGPPDAEVRAALAAADAAKTSEQSKAVIAQIEALRSRGDAYEQTRLEIEHGNMLLHLEHHEEAAEAFLSAGRQAERLGWLSVAARTYQTSGEAAHLVYDVEAMLTAWEGRLNVEQARENEEGIALALMYVGLMHVELGDIEESYRYLRESLAANEAIGNDDGTAWVLNNLATVHHRRGEYHLEQAALERALFLSRQVGNEFREAAVLCDQGALFSVLHENDRARDVLQASMALYREMEYEPGIVQCVGALGLICADEGDYDCAIEQYEKCLTYYKRTNDAHFTCTVLNSLGYAYLEKGELERAEEYEREALRVGEELSDPWWAAHARQSLADVLIAQDRYEEAEKHLSRSLNEARKLAAPLLIMIAHRGLAELLLAQGEPARAVRHSERAMEQSEALLSGLAHSQAASVRDMATKVYDVATKAAVASGNPSAIFTALESARAGALLEVLENRAEIRAVKIPEKLRARERDAKLAALAALRRYQRTVEDGKLREMRKSRAALDSARESVSHVVAQIQRTAKSTASVLYPLAATLEDVQAELVAGDTMVIYSLVGDEAFAQVVTKDAATTVSLGSRDDIVAAASADLADPDEDEATAVATLRQKIVEPLDLPKSTRRCLISPDGILGFTPFSLLIPDVDVVYVPSGTAYRVLRQSRPTPGTGVLALGDPDYGIGAAEETTPPTRGGMLLVPLPATRDEANQIGDVVLLGEGATKSALLEALGRRSRWEAVHLACHGLVDPARPMTTALALAFETDGSNLLRCEEVFTCDIPADLTVLSACETGKGAVYRCEGIVGLAQAFMLAGSPRVLVSLWKVDDEATQALMLKFYELWRPKDGEPGLPAAAALAKAQAHVRSHEKWEHPYYWAAWVLWGLP